MASCFQNIVRMQAKTTKNYTEVDGKLLIGMPSAVTLTSEPVSDLENQLWPNCGKYLCKFCSSPFSG